MGDAWDVGRWRVNFREGWIVRRRKIRAEQIRPDPRLMLVFKALIENAGQSVTTQSILDTAWSGRVVSRDSVSTAIYQLRQILGDSADRPVYIASEPRVGYRLIAKVRPVVSRRSTPLIYGLCSISFISAIAIWSLWQAPYHPGALYMEPLENFSASPVDEPIALAIESTLLSELIQLVPGRVQTKDGDNIALRLQSRMVQCDLGPTLVMRLLDTRSNTYVWSESYNLAEAAASPVRPSLVQKAAMDVGAAML